MATSKLPAGTAAFYTDLITQATAELATLTSQLAGAQSSFDGWYNLFSRGTGMDSGKGSCGFKDGCSENDRVAFYAARSNRDSLQAQVNAKNLELSGYQTSLATVNANTNPDTINAQTQANLAAQNAQTLASLKAQINKNWKYIIITALVLAAIVGGFIVWKKYGGKGTKLSAS